MLFCSPSSADRGIGPADRSPHQPLTPVCWELAQPLATALALAANHRLSCIIACDNTWQQCWRGCPRRGGLMAEEGAAHRNEAAVSLHEINRSLSLRPRRYWADTGPVRVQVRRWRWDGCTRGAHERARRIPTEPSAARPARRPRRTPARSCAQRSSHRAPGRSTGPPKARSAAPGGPAALTSAGASP
jgi:hypothetical protein